MNSAFSLIGSPIKISGVRDLLHKYNNFFFDLDGVVVQILSNQVARRTSDQGIH